MNWEQLSEQELILALNQREEAAFNQIYRRYWRLLFEAAVRRVQDEDQAKDIVQDVFAGLWDQRDTFCVENLKAYLLTAVKYQIFNLIARKKVSDKYFRRLNKTEPVSSDADETLCFNELVSQYDTILREMPDKRKEIYKLRYDEGLSTQHIAEKLHITQKTVQNQLVKAVHFIKSTLLTLLLFLLQ